MLACSFFASAFACFRSCSSLSCEACREQLRCVHILPVVLKQDYHVPRFVAEQLFRWSLHSTLCHQELVLAV